MPPSADCDIGLVGLAVMGENLALNIASRGFKIAVYNRTTSVTDAFTAGIQGLLSTDWPSPNRADLVGAVVAVAATATAISARNWKYMQVQTPGGTAETAADCSRRRCLS